MILLADDDPLFLQRSESVLARDEFVYFARDGQSARELLVTIGADFTIVLVNAEMENGDGLALIREIRGMAPDLPVIAIGGGDRAREAGACDVVRKPLTSEWRGAIERARAAGR
ncbi:MAG TPA: response regulator [Candidatus Limnocylindrales bacterium]|nr:response regulator [Candidatus Limnocylindrales bacterium]